MFGKDKKKKTNKKPAESRKMVSKPEKAPRSTAKPRAPKKDKTKAIELTELEASKVYACIGYMALQDEIRATKLDRKVKLSNKELDELEQCRARSSFYNLLAKKFE